MLLHPRCWRRAGRCVPIALGGERPVGDRSTAAGTNYTAKDGPAVLPCSAPGQTAHSSDAPIHPQSLCIDRILKRPTCGPDDELVRLNREFPLFPTQKKHSLKSNGALGQSEFLCRSAVCPDLDTMQSLTRDTQDCYIKDKHSTEVALEPAQTPGSRQKS